MKRDLEFALQEVSASALWRSAPIRAAFLAVVAILAIYASTAASIVAIWIRSETFAHGFIVIPICLWLAWRKRDALAAVEVRPWWPGLALVAAAGALWFVMSAANVLGVRQFALAFMLQAAIVTIIGLKAARVAAFPLAFLLFAVPAGEFMVPTLIDWTADFTVAAIRLSGVPVYREGNHFNIPSGQWSIVDACSGIRYIIAAVMVGTIYAAVAFRSPRRRALFLAASLLVPIVANWLRAYIIVMTGHLSDNRLATGVDHIIYGWIFFGAVMLLLFWVGSYWQEREPAPRSAVADPRPITTIARAPRPFYAAAAAAVAAALIWPPLEAAVDRSAPPGRPSLPAVAASDGWTSVNEPIADWKPVYIGQVAEDWQTFARGNRRVGLYLAYYRAQEFGRGLITSVNVLTTPDSWMWKLTASGNGEVAWLGAPIAVDRAELTGRRMKLEAYRLYWIDGRVTASPYEVKARQAWSKLAGRGDDAALIVFYTESSSNEGAQRLLGEFAAAMSPAIERALAAARKSGREDAPSQR